MLKSWRLITTSAIVRDTVTKVCTHTEPHVRIQGRNTKISENYPSSLAADINAAYRTDILYNPGHVRSLLGYNLAPSRRSAPARRHRAMAGLVATRWSTRANTTTTNTTIPQGKGIPPGLCRTSSPRVLKPQAPRDVRYNALVTTLPAVLGMTASTQREGLLNGHGHDVESMDEVARNDPFGGTRLWPFRTEVAYCVRWLPTLADHAPSYGGAWRQRLSNFVSAGYELFEASTASFSAVSPDKLLSEYTGCPTSRVRHVTDESTTRRWRGSVATPTSRCRRQPRRTLTTGRSISSGTPPYSRTRRMERGSSPCTSLSAFMAHTLGRT